MHESIANRISLTSHWFRFLAERTSPASHKASSGRGVLRSATSPACHRCMQSAYAACAACQAEYCSSAIARRVSKCAARFAHRALKPSLWNRLVGVSCVTFSQKITCKLEQAKLQVRAFHCEHSMRATGAKSSRTRMVHTDRRGACTARTTHHTTEALLGNRGPAA